MCGEKRSDRQVAGQVRACDPIEICVWLDAQHFKFHLYLLCVRSVLVKRNTVLSYLCMGGLQRDIAKMAVCPPKLFAWSP